MKTIDRYLMTSVIGPFLFGVVAFVLLFVSANILFKLVELVNQLGLSITTSVALFFLWLPGFIVLTFPLATLVSILIVFGRLSGDSELVAMFAGGISFRRLIVPLLCFGLLVSLVTAALNEFVAPAAQKRADDIVKAATVAAGKNYEQSVLMKEAAHGQLLRLIYADRLDLRTQEMVRPVIVWFRDNKPAMMTVAQRARWVGNDWEMLDGENHIFSPDRTIVVKFPKWDAHFSTSPKQLLAQTRKPEEMTYRELKDYIAHALRQDKPVIELELALQHKFSIPFASLVFVLIAPPLGLRSHRGAGSIGMGLAILIGFAYYVVWNYLSVTAQQGGVTAFWAAWLPNLITAAIGLLLIARVRR